MFGIDKKLFTIYFISFINAISLTIVIPVLYEYGTTFGFSPAEIGLLLSLFAFSQFFANPILGKLSDKYGRKKILALSLFGTYLSNMIAFFAPNGAILLLARVLDGITGGNNSVAQAVISDLTKPQDRPKAFGLFGAAFGLAFIFGPLLSILLVNTFGLNVPFLGAALLALLGTILTVYWLPETNFHKEDDPITLATLGLGKVISGLRYKQYNTYLIVTFFSSLVFGIFQIAIQPYSVDTLRIGSAGIGSILLTFGIVSIFAQTMIVPYSIKKYGFGVTQIFGTLVTAILFILMPLSSSVFYFFAIITIFSLSSLLYRQIATSLISINAKREDGGVAIGLLESYFSLGNAIGPLIGGLIIKFSKDNQLTLFHLNYTAIPFLASGIILIFLLFYIYLNLRKFQILREAKQDL